MIEKLKEWATAEDNIRGLILTGSRAIKGKFDKLSDYDVKIFTNNSSIYTKSDSWLSKIGNSLICVHEKLLWYKETIQTRLVIFEGGVKVDFSFYPIEALTSLTKGSLPEEYNAGYHVIIDKDKVCKQLPKPSFNSYKQKPPTEKEFHRVINEFWFEAYHVAKYLARGDLWSVKFRDNGLKQEFLLQMIRWNEQAKHQWDYSTHSQGKRMQEWVGEETWDSLQKCFAHYSSSDSWSALNKTLSLFRHLSKETASLLKYSYPNNLDKNISSLIQKYKLY